MIWGVFSDVHSNIEALEAVLDAFKRHDVEGFVCCGDLVGYGPSPNEVVERVAGLKPLHAVIGNHDLAVIGRMDLAWFNPYAQAAAIWTRWKLSKEASGFLEAMPTRLETPEFTIVHGSPRSPSEEYLLTPQQFVDNQAHYKISPCFVGHSHLTWCFSKDEANPFGAKTHILADRERVVCKPNIPWVINPGSVGQPRDHDQRASCGVYDDVKREFTLLRVPYDIPTVQARMKEAGLPDFLIMRLAYGQ
ncbi:MAG: metallophosphoesterase family protein [Elusimicrobia bacterium]|nr:metallophosphoesterase family protein [Elusimicrobiota bacterium]